MRRLVVVILGLVIGSAALAQSWYEPARGTPERRDLMDAIRPHVEWVLGAPVEFVVDELRVSGNLGFAMLTAQRPGGAPIDVGRTPGLEWGMFEPDLGDPTQVQVLYKKSGAVWVAVHHGLASTDVWFAWEPFCREYRPVIPDYCQ